MQSAEETQIVLSRRRLLQAGGIAGVAAVAAGAFGWAGSTRPNPSTDAQPAPTAKAARHSFRSRPDLTPPVVSINIPAASVAPGLIFFTPANGAGHDGPMIVDNAGNPIWVHPGTGKLATNLRVSQFEGSPVLTWWEGTQNGGNGLGEFVMLDSSYREIVRIQAGDGLQADLHEFLITPRNTAIFTASNWGYGHLPSTQGLPYLLWDNVIQEVDVRSGSLLFEWHTYDHIEPSESYEPPPTKAGQAFDYVHSNSIEEDRDGNLLLSARHTFAVYKIDRTTGAILWRLGGKRSDFRFGPGASFSWQHDARRQADGSMTIFDDEAAPGHSRAIVLAVDEQARTAQLVRAYSHPKGLLATSQGNMQVLPNGNVFVGWGASPYFSEFAAGGQLLFDATFPSATQSYRSYRFPWLGQPVEKPALAVLARGMGSADVYASWNGATEVASWNVLSGHEKDALQLVGSGPKVGFETSFSVGSWGPYFAVQAKDANGRLLATSDPVLPTL